MEEHNMRETGLRANRDFRRYFSARVVWQLGDQLYAFAICWFVLDITKSSFHVAGILAVNSLAAMAVAPFGGIIADRFSRKRVMIATDLLQGLVLLALFVLLQAHLLSVAVLYAGTVLLGLCGAVFSPAASAVVPGIVEGKHLPGAVAANQVAANFCTIAGMLLGGALYTFIGISWILVLNAASNLAAAAMESGIRIAAGVPVKDRCSGSLAAELKRFAVELAEGFRHVKADREIFALLMINTGFTLCALPIAIVYLPYMFNVVLGATSLQAAIPQAATWAGIILGSAAAMRLLRRHPPQALIAAGLLGLAVHSLLMVPLYAVRFLLGASGMSAACTLANGIAGAAGSFFIVPLYARFHARSVDRFRGRFWGLESSLRTAATFAGFLIAGVLAQRLRLGFVFAGTAAVMSVLFLQVLRLRRAGVEAEEAPAFRPGASDADAR